MNSDELAKMVEMARGFQEWELDNDNGTNFRRLDVIDLADTPQAGLVIAQGVGEELGWFLTQVPAAIVALAEQLEQMKVGKDTLVHIAFDYWQELEALKAKLAALKASLAEGATP